MNKRLVAISLLLMLVSPVLLLSPPMPAYASTLVELDDPTEDGLIYSDYVASNDCALTGFTKVPNSVFNVATISPSTSTSPCRVAYIEWNITGIPDGSTINELEFEYYFESVVNLGDRDGQIRAMQYQPSITVEAQVFNDTQDGATYVAALNETTPAFPGTHIVTLDAQANADFQSQLTDDWFAIGLSLTNMTRDASHHTYSTYSEDFPRDVRLWVNYTEGAGPGPDTPETVDLVLPDLDFDPIMFVDKFYTMEQVVRSNGTIDAVKVRFSDGYETFVLQFRNGTGIFSVPQGGDYIVLDTAHSEVDRSLSGSHNYTYQITYRFKLLNTVQDHIGVDFETYVNATDGSTTGWEASLTDHCDIYNHGGWVEFANNSGNAGRFAGGDTFEIWAVEGGWVAVNQTWHHLEHYHAQFAIRHSENGTGEDQYWQDSAHVVGGEKHSDKGDWILWIYWYYFDPVEKVYVEGWAARLMMERGDEGDIEWTDINCTWYTSGVQVKTDSVNAFIEEEPKAQVRLWLDLWFNKMNASTTHGGRINSMYYPITLNGSLWWADWLPGYNMTTQSMFFDENLDYDGDLVPSQKLELVKVGFNLSRPSTASGELNFRTEVIGFQISEFNLADSDIVDGVNTPIFVDTKVPDLPVNSFLAPIYTALMMIGDTIMNALAYASEWVWQGIRDRWPWFTDFWENSLETIYSLGEIFTIMWTHMTNLFSFLVDLFGYVTYPIQVIQQAWATVQAAFTWIDGLNLRDLIVVVLLVLIFVPVIGAVTAGDWGYLFKMAQVTWRIVYALFDIFYRFVTFVVNAILSLIPL